MVAIGADSFVEASCQLGEPGQRGEPRGFQTGVLESFFADGVGHDDRGLDERKRVRVEQPVLPEHAADLSQLELDGGDVGAAGPDLLRVHRMVRQEDEVAHQGPVRIHDGDEADLRFVEMETIGLIQVVCSLPGEEGVHSDGRVGQVREHRPRLGGRECRRANQRGDET